MQVAPTPSSGSRIEELGDTLVVTFRPRRSWPEILFLGFWLTFWTFGGIAAANAARTAGWGGRAFLLVWLCGWLVGEGAVAVRIAWLLCGRETLSLMPNRLEIRKRVGRFSRAHDLHLLAVDDVWAERVPAGEDEAPSEQFRLTFLARGERMHFGEGLAAREAELIAAVVRERLRPRSRWSDDLPTFGFEPEPEREPVLVREEPPSVAIESATPAVRWQWVLPRIVPALFGAGVLALAAWVILPAVRHPPELPNIEWPAAPTHTTPSVTAPTGARAAGMSPVREDYDHPRAFAEATTRWALTSARNHLESKPACGDRVTWTTWTCRALAVSADGPFEGRRLVYRCYVSFEAQPVGPAARTINCGPENPPPITR